MRIYVIECGEYSDRGVFGVTDSEEKAKEIVAKIRAYSGYGFEDPSYTEYDTEECEQDARHLNDVMWRVSFLNASYTIAESDADEEGIVERPDGAIDVWVEADTEDKALKIAADRRAEYIANKLLTN